jgi:hypothetical protein
MATDVAICNLSLARVGVQQEIASLSEVGTLAKSCRRFYDQSRQAMLREFPWSFCERPVTLALVEAEPVSDWIFSYRYPSDTMRMNRIVGVRRRPDAPIPFRIGSDSQGRLIYTDQEYAVAWCNYDVSDTSQFDPLFTDAIAWRIARELAPLLSKDSGLTQSVRQEYEMAVRRAIASALNEEGQEENPCSLVEAYN